MGNFPSLDHPPGEKHVFPGFGERIVWVPGIFPGSCFGVGLPYNPQWGNPPNKNYVALIVFDSFDPKKPQNVALIRV